MFEVKGFNQNRGWMCPRCERCYSPDTAECLHCQPKEWVISDTSQIHDFNQNRTTNVTGILSKSIREAR